jgi:hypothetical protein
MASQETPEAGRTAITSDHIIRLEYQSGVYTNNLMRYPKPTMLYANAQNAIAFPQYPKEGHGMQVSSKADAFIRTLCLS